MGLVEDIGTYLAAQSTLFVLGTKTFLNFMPDSPNRAQSIIETGGPAPEFVMGASTKVAIEHPRIQMVCRSTSSTAARADMDRAWVILNGVANQVLSGTTYLRISAVQSPFLLERDAKGRPVFGCNFDVMRRR